MNGTRKTTSRVLRLVFTPQLCRRQVVREFLASPNAVPLNLFQDVVPSSPADAITSVARLFP